MSREEYRILTLDGGGSKGFYTLGILTQLETVILKKPLHQSFDLIYGTSTGAIIGSLIALGYSATEIHQLYCEHLPTIMQPLLAKQKSDALKTLALHFYGDNNLDDLLVEMGITALTWPTKKPVIFRTHNPKLQNFDHLLDQFSPSLADAVVTSCSAIPLFEPYTVNDQNGEPFQMVDGGFYANNPSLLAISDAINRGIDPHHITLVSLGTGEFPYPDRFQKARNLLPDLMGYSQLGEFFQNILQANTEMVAPLIKALYPDLNQIRINPHYNSPDVDFVEYDLEKLDALFQLGIDAFQIHYDSLAPLRSLSKLVKNDKSSIWKKWGRCLNPLSK